MPITVPDYYPVDLNIEVTSYCNSKCRFCTHEDLVKSGKKPQNHMDFALVKQTLDTLRNITQEQNIPDNQIRIGPVGLGEPLLYPHFFETISYARQLFPGAHIHANSNCIVLKGKIAEQLIGSELDSLVLSLGFNNSQDYKEQFRVDKFNEVSENIRNFLREKGNRSPRAIIHIFDLNLTSKVYSEFYSEWSALLSENDTLRLEKYIPLTEGLQQNNIKYPCSQLWTTIMVDNEGYVFPCCLGVWTSRDKDLCLGHISNDWNVLFQRVEEIRQQHMEGIYLGCKNCAYLTTYEKYLGDFYRAIKKAKKEHLGNKITFDSPSFTN